MTYTGDGLPNLHHTPAAAYGAYLEHGDDTARTVTCATCGHSWITHYTDPTTHGNGCVALWPARPTVAAAVAGQPAAPFIEGVHGCLCPGYTQGRLPHAITKHLTGLVDDDNDTGCDRCHHPLAQHSTDHGCWTCPCATSETPGT